MSTATDTGCRKVETKLEFEVMMSTILVAATTIDKIVAATVTAAAFKLTPKVVAKEIECAPSIPTSAFRKTAAMNPFARCSFTTYPQSSATIDPSNSQLNLVLTGILQTCLCEHCVKV